MNDQVNSMMAGMQQANQGRPSFALAGLMPQSGSPRGAPAPTNPCSAEFYQAVQSLNALAECLQRNAMHPQSLDVQDMSVELKRLFNDVSGEIAKRGAGMMPMQSQGAAMPSQFPNVNGGGVV